MNKLSEFKNRKVSLIETMHVKDGVECSIYSFVGDATQDLAIVRVTKGLKTPIQKILKGNKTIQGLLEGKGMLVVQLENGATNTYDLDIICTNKEVEVKVGQIMQWTASADIDLVFYEICDPPYRDGRFEDLPE